MGKHGNIAMIGRMSSLGCLGMIGGLDRIDDLGRLGNSGILSHFDSTPLRWGQQTFRFFGIGAFSSARGIGFLWYKVGFQR